MTLVLVSPVEMTFTMCKGDTGSFNKKCIHYRITVMSLFAIGNIDKFPFTTAVVQLTLGSIQPPIYWVHDFQLVGHRVISRTPWSHSFVAILAPPSDTWFLLSSSVIIFVRNKIYIHSQLLLSS
jgi:hypothetical protein